MFYKKNIPIKKKLNINLITSLISNDHHVDFVNLGYNKILERITREFKNMNIKQLEEVGKIDQRIITQIEEVYYKYEL